MRKKEWEEEKEETEWRKKENDVWMGDDVVGLRRFREEEDDGSRDLQTIVEIDPHLTRV